MSRTPRRCGIWTATLVVFTLSSAGIPAQGPPADLPQFVVVGPVRVIQADTFEVWVNGARIGVGLVGVKAPHRNTPCGRQATRVTSRLVKGSLEFSEDPGMPPLDPPGYRRMYRVAMLPSGASLATTLARAGLVRVDPDAVGAAEYGELVAAEADARADHSGCLWVRIEPGGHK